MNEDKNSYQYSIQIGGKSILNLDVSEEDLFSDIDEAEIESLSKKLKEMRVRIGTLLKTDNVSFLIGAGASISAGGISLAKIPRALELLLMEHAAQETKKRPPGWITLFYDSVSALTDSTINMNHRTVEIEELLGISEITLNLEDYLSHLHMWLAGMINNQVIQKLPNGNLLRINRKDIERLIQEITNALSGLLDLPKQGNEASLYHHNRFIKKILTRPLNLKRANIFTLNYDTLLEKAADAEGVVLVDGFVGTLNRVFRPESFNLDYYFPAQTTEGQVHRFDRVLHLYKLHGSITWRRCKPEWENPYGVYIPYNLDDSQDSVLIYPTPLKYGQALGLPYSELFRRFNNAVVQPQSVLFVIGYGFGDEHVNALIRQALAIPSFTLIVVDPYPESSFVKGLQQSGDERIWIIAGRDLGKFEHFVEKILPDLREEEIEKKVIKTFNDLESPGK